MTKLREIYNPLSDTFLVMEERKALLGHRFLVYRQARSPEYIIEKGIHDGAFGMFSTRDEQRAEAIFKKRLTDEAAKPIEKLTSYFYFETGKGRHVANAAAALDKLNLLKLQSQFGYEAYRLEVCDSPRRKLYAFETEYFGYPSKKQLNSKQVRSLVARVVKDLNLPHMPEIKFRDHPVYETHLGEKREIKATALPGIFPELEFKRTNGMVCMRIVLHEMAHIVVGETHPSAISHGPHFARAAATLYDRYFGLDHKRYFDLANDPKYKIFGPDTYGPEDVLIKDFAIEANSLDAGILRLLQTTQSWLTCFRAGSPRP